jgi:hypothetical protein
MFAGGNMFATAAGDLSARGAPFAAMRALRLAMREGQRVCGREIGSEVGRSGNGSRGRVAVVRAFAVEQAVAADDPAAGTLV